MISEEKPAYARTSPNFFEIKRYENGNMEKFKARVVTGEHWQVYQRDYDTVHAPVLRFTLSVCTLILTIIFGKFCKHVDVAIAFLIGEIDIKLFISFPTEFQVAASRGPSLGFAKGYMGRNRHHFYGNEIYDTS